MIENNFVNGRMFLEAAECYVNQINSGGVPCIENAWTYIQKEEIQKVYSESLKKLPNVIQEME